MKAYELERVLLVNTALNSLNRIGALVFDESETV
jgi:hypothetical protein